jgi:formate hydrogenlyase transcriptional activator
VTQVSVPDEPETALGRDELAALLAINRTIGRHLRRDQLFGALATCLKTVVSTDRFGIELPIEGERLQGHLLTPRGVDEEPTRPTVLPARGTACDWVLHHREWLVFSRRDELRERFPVTFDVMQSGSMESLCALPLMTEEGCRAVLFFMAAAPGAYRQLRRGVLEQIASAVAVALDHCLAHEEVRRLRDQLAAENVYLREEIKQDHHFDEIVGNSPTLRQMIALIQRVAPTDATALILGETGTGKELVVRALHERSARRERPLVKVNCAAIPAGLVESELFGHEKGAFTGAAEKRTGRFALADRGTIFLDEIGDIPLEVQVRLLRVLQEREFEPIGSSKTVTVDVRVIAATNRDLAAAVAAGSFRADLFYRLNVFPIQVPPLRARREDVAPLVHYFIRKYATKIGKHIESVSESTMQRLVAYSWPGNIRELENVIERAVILSPGPSLEVEAQVVPAPSAGSPGDQTGAETETTPTLEESARFHILHTLKSCGWVVDGPRGAAAILGVHPNTLRSRMKKLGIRRTNDAAS